MGTMTFGGKGIFSAVGNGSAEDAARQIGFCLDAGVNVIDTANAYSDGACEEIVGKALQDLGRRQDIVLASKVRYPQGKGPNEKGLSRYHIIRECEKSLKRLRTDTIDLYQTHEWDGLTPIEETLEALAHLQRQGKIQYIGCCNYTGWQIGRAMQASAVNQLPKFVSQQIHYTCQAREAELELVPSSLEYGLGLLVWSPLAGGLLTGAQSREKGGLLNARRAGGWTEPPVYDEERLWRIVDTLVEIGKAHGVSAAPVGLAWLLDKPAVTSVIVGGLNEQQFAENLRAATLVLSEEEKEAIEKVSVLPLPYPHWHQATTVSDLLGPTDLAQLGRHIA